MKCLTYIFSCLAPSSPILWLCYSLHLEIQQDHLAPVLTQQSSDVNFSHVICFYLIFCGDVTVSSWKSHTTQQPDDYFSCVIGYVSLAIVTYPLVTLYGYVQFYLGVSCNGKLNTNLLQIAKWIIPKREVGQVEGQADEWMQGKLHIDTTWNLIFPCFENVDRRGINMPIHVHSFIYRTNSFKFNKTQNKLELSDNKY